MLHRSLAVYPCSAFGMPVAVDVSLPSWHCHEAKECHCAVHCRFSIYCEWVWQPMLAVASLLASGTSGRLILRWMVEKHVECGILSAFPPLIDIDFGWKRAGSCDFTDTPPPISRSTISQLRIMHHACQRCWSVVYGRRNRNADIEKNEKMST